MKIKIVAPALLLASLALGTQTSIAQMAKDKSVSETELSTHIRNLMNANTDSARAELRKEVAVLEKSKDENKMSLAYYAYSFALNDDATADKLWKAIIAEFPKGFTARSEGSSKIFDDTEGRDKTTVYEERHKAWLAAFPPENFPKSDLWAYDSPLLYLSLNFAEAKKHEKAAAYIAQIHRDDEYVKAVFGTMNRVAMEDLKRMMK